MVVVLYLGAFPTSWRDSMLLLLLLLLLLLFSFGLDSTIAILTHSLSVVAAIAVIIGLHILRHIPD